VPVERRGRPGRHRPPARPPGDHPVLQDRRSFVRHRTTGGARLERPRQRTRRRRRAGPLPFGAAPKAPPLSRGLLLSTGEMPRGPSSILFWKKRRCRGATSRVENGCDLPFAESLRRRAGPSEAPVSARGRAEAGREGQLVGVVECGAWVGWSGGPGEGAGDECPPWCAHSLRRTFFQISTKLS
jgi:hypothetical protein